MNEVQDFCKWACQVCPDTSDMTCMVYVDIDGWDSPKQAYNDIESFAEGDNDPIGEEIDIELEEMGLVLVYPGELVDDTSIEFKMRRV
jgi:hypothetical protein